MNLISDWTSIFISSSSGYYRRFKYRSITWYCTIVTSKWIFWFFLSFCQKKVFVFLIHQSGLHASRPHIGQNLVAQRLRALLASPLHPSTISQSHTNCGKVQDAYSIRCIPQVRTKINIFFVSSFLIGSWHIMGYY